nr:ester cyclase [Scopulibacillus darangshiensis]
MGLNEIQGMFISLFASFPTAKFIVERVTCNQRKDADEWDVAVRWRLQGIHEGIGYFGRPSNKPIKILGINHVRVRNEKIVEEWMAFDGMDVLKQIHTNAENTSSD